MPRSLRSPRIRGSCRDIAASLLSGVFRGPAPGQVSVGGRPGGGRPEFRSRKWTRPGLGFGRTPAPGTGSGSPKSASSRALALVAPIFTQSRALRANFGATFRTTVAPGRSQATPRLGRPTERTHNSFPNNLLLHDYQQAQCRCTCERRTDCRDPRGYGDIEDLITTSRSHANAVVYTG